MTSAFDELLEAARKLGFAIRHARLGGAGGGVARFKSQSQLFVDLDADPADQIEQTARALAREPGLDALFLRPDVRELIDAHRV
jgi:hypothetical protein